MRQIDIEKQRERERETKKLQKKGLEKLAVIFLFDLLVGIGWINL